MSRSALVIAITRLGDIIQTEPMVRALKRDHSFEKVTVLVEHSFSDIASKISSADEVKYVDFETILGQLDRRTCTLPLREYLTLSEWMRAEQFDVVYNVTHTRPSMFLAALAGKDAHGVSLDQSGMQVVNNRWLQYFFATNLARPWCSFNLVDVYVNAVSQLPKYSDRKPQFMTTIPTDKTKLQNDERGEVLLHVGASKSDKQWPLERFVELSKYLLARGMNVTLIGGKKSDVVSAVFPSHRKFRDLQGATSVENLFDLCASARFMVSADSGPVHVAAACDLTIIAIEGGSAHGFETAPYNVGSFVIQPHLEDLMTRRPGKQVTSAPADLISVQTVTTTIEYMLDERNSIEKSPHCTVYETKPGSEVPGLELRSICESHTEYEEWQHKLRQFWWKIGLDGKTIDTRLNNELTSLAFESARAAKSVAEAGDNVRSLERRAASLSMAEKCLTQMIEAFPPLHHLNYFLQIARSSVQGDTPQEQALELEKLYDDIARAANDLELHGSRRSGKNQIYSNTEKVPA